MFLFLFEPYLQISNVQLLTLTSFHHNIRNKMYFIVHHHHNFESLN